MEFSDLCVYRNSCKHKCTKDCSGFVLDNTKACSQDRVFYALACLREDRLKDRKTVDFLSLLMGFFMVDIPDNLSVEQFIKEFQEMYDKMD